MLLVKLVPVNFLIGFPQTSEYSPGELKEKLM